MRPQMFSAGPLFRPGSIYPPEIWGPLFLLAKITSGEPQEGLQCLNPHTISTLRQHHLTAWLYREVAQHGWEKFISPPFLQDLRQDYASSLIGTNIQQEKIFRVIRALRQANLEVILLKGADLRYRLYGDPAVRPMEDLDLLLAPEDLFTAGRVLADLGYPRAPKYLDLVPNYWQLLGEAIHYQPADESLIVDVHWEIGALLYYYRIPYPSLRRDALSISCEGLQVYVLSPEHLLIHLCLNAYKDLFDAVLRVLDITLVLARLSLDWRKVIQEASAFRCQRPFYLILREIARVAPHLVPTQVLTELARYRPSFAEGMILKGRLRYLTLGLPSFYRHRSLRDWFKVIKATLWPEADYLSAGYEGDRLAYLRDLSGRLFPPGAFGSPKLKGKEGRKAKRESAGR